MEGRQSSVTMAGRLPLILLALSPTLSLPLSLDLFEEDIILNDHQKLFFLNDVERKLVTRSEENTRIWPGAILYYHFKEGEFTNDVIARILDAMYDIELVSCVRFLPRYSTQFPYIRFRNVGSQCASTVGYIHVNSGVDLYLGGSTCHTKGTIQHELLHALGFWHEHTRPDRDEHININWNNIIPGTEINFMKRTAAESPMQSMPYDYGSVMHYRAKAFSKDGLSLTLEPRDRSAIPQMGQRVRFSTVDLAKLNRLYQCPYPYYKGDELTGMRSIIGRHDLQARTIEVDPQGTNDLDSSKESEADQKNPEVTENLKRPTEK